MLSQHDPGRDQADQDPRHDGLAAAELAHPGHLGLDHDARVDGRDLEVALQPQVHVQADAHGGDRHQREPDGHPLGERDGRAVGREVADHDGVAASRCRRARPTLVGGEAGAEHEEQRQCPVLLDAVRLAGRLVDAHQDRDQQGYQRMLRQEGSRHGDARVEQEGEGDRALDTARAG